MRERGGAGGSAAAEVQQRRTLPLEVYAPQGEEWRDAQPRARIRRRRHQQRAELRGCASGRFASAATAPRRAEHFAIKLHRGAGG